MPATYPDKRLQNFTLRVQMGDVGKIDEGVGVHFPGCGRG
jgi:hypothetical protein